MRLSVSLCLALLCSPCVAACGASGTQSAADGGALSDGGAPSDGGAGACGNYAPPELVATLEAPGLGEGSGLAASARAPGVLFAHNDSGNAAEVFALRADGRLAAKWTVAGAQNVDWEDLARGPCSAGATTSCLYLGDIGDNAARRSEGVQIYVVAEPDVARPASQPLPLVRTLWLRYPDGPRDCESLLVHPTTADLYLVEKRPRTDGLAGRAVYKAAADTTGTQAAPAVLQRLSFLDVPPDSDGLFTAGDVHPGGRRVALRTYTAIVEYRLPEGRPFDEIFAQVPVRLPRAEGSGGMELQGESLAYAADGRALYTSSEGSNPPLNRWACVD